MVRDTATNPSSDTRWPAPGWCATPDLSIASETARRVRKLLFGPRAFGVPIADVKRLAARAGAHVVETDLAASAGGCEALLIPIVGNRFQIAVDPTPRSGWRDHPPDLLRTVARQRSRFRVAHELGHTLFYARSPERVPRRFARAGVEEERFCDRFATALLLPDYVLAECRTAGHLVEIQRVYDVSLEVVVRALAEVQSVEAALFYWTPAARSPMVQWTNLSNRSRLARWRSVVASAVRSAEARLSVPAADTVLLSPRAQAVVVASR